MLFSRGGRYRETQLCDVVLRILHMVRLHASHQCQQGTPLVLALGMMAYDHAAQHQIFTPGILVGCIVQCACQLRFAHGVSLVLVDGVGFEFSACPNIIRPQLAGGHMAANCGAGGGAGCIEPLIAVLGTACTATVDAIGLNGDVATTYLGDLRIAVAITHPSITKPFSFPSATTPPRR